MSGFLLRLFKETRCMSICSQNSVPSFSEVKLLVFANKVLLTDFEVVNKVFTLYDLLCGSLLRWRLNQFRFKLIQVEQTLLRYHFELTFPLASELDPSCS